MKTFKAALAAVLVLLPAMAWASLFAVESQVAWSDYGGESEAYEDVRLEVAYGDDLFGVFAYGYANTDTSDETYREFYLGPYLAPTDWLEFGVGYGAEEFDDEDGRESSPRFGAYVSFIADFGYAELVFEDGDSGYYYEHYFSYDPTDWLGVGGIWFQNLGYGPRLEIRTPLSETTSLNVWAAYIFGDEDKGQPKDSIVLNVQIAYDK